MSWIEVERKRGRVTEEEDKIAFLCKLTVVEGVEVEDAVWGWEELWPKGIRSKFNRRPSPSAK